MNEDTCNYTLLYTNQVELSCDELIIIVQYLVIGFIGAAAQLAEDLIVDVVVVERVETLAVVRDARVEGRVEAEQVIVARKHVT